MVNWIELNWILLLAKTSVMNRKNSSPLYTYVHQSPLSIYTAIPFLWKTEAKQSCGATTQLLVWLKVVEEVVYWDNIICSSTLLAYLHSLTHSLQPQNRSEWSNQLCSQDPGQAPRANPTLQTFFANVIVVSSSSSSGIIMDLITWLLLDHPHDWWL